MATILNEKTRFIVEKLSNSSLWAKIDETLYPLINAINALQGITTDVCCDGHGKSFPYLYLSIDGTVESLQNLGAISQSVAPFNWIISADTISIDDGFGLYFVLAPLETFANNNGRVNFIKVKKSEACGRNFDENHFLELAQAITKGKRAKKFGLRKPLFVIPEHFNQVG